MINRLHLSSQLTLTRLLPYSMALVLAASLIFKLLPSRYARFWADDFCYAAVASREGFWGAQTFWYQNWSGRFAYTFVSAIAGAAGESGVPFLGFVVVAIWLFGFTWLILELSKYHGIPLRFISAVLLGELVIVLSLSSAPDLAQILYWQTGMLTYLVPLVIATHISAFVLFVSRSGHSSASSILLVFALSVVACGFSETTSIFFLASALLLCFVLLIVRNAPHRPALLRLSLASLSGCLLATVVVASAPGNAVRQESFTPPDSLFRWLDLTLKYAVVFSARSIIRNIAIFALAVLAGSIAGLWFSEAKTRGKQVASRKNKHAFLLFTIPIATFLLVMSTIAPSVYVKAGLPPPRAQFISQFILVCSACVWGYTLGGYVSSRMHLETAGSITVSEHKLGSLIQYVLAISASAVLVLLTANSIHHSIITINDASDYAYGWVQRNLVIREQVGAKIESVRIAPLRSFPGIQEESEPTTDSTYWVNECIADYYGAESITVDSALPNYSDARSASE